MQSCSQDLTEAITKIQEGLFVKSLFQGAERSDTVTDPRQPVSKPAASEWHRFLDELSHLCQFKVAGEDVTSVAAQASGDDTVFWIVSNTGAQAEVRRSHLEWIIVRLSSISTSIPWETERVTENVSECIFTESVRLSSTRIHNYRTTLASRLKKINSTLSPGDDQGE